MQAEDMFVAFIPFSFLFHSMDDGSIVCARWKVWAVLLLRYSFSLVSERRASEWMSKLVVSSLMVS